MRPCNLFEPAAIELYFYDELDPTVRARVEAHLAVCVGCRQELLDLDVIRRALADRPRVEEPPAGDWSGFMRRLDEACGIGPADRRGGVEGHAGEGHGRNGQRVARWRPALAVAAMLLMVTIGAVLAARFRSSVTTATPPVATASPPPPPAPATIANAGQPAVRAADHALAELSEQHFERSKLVVLGLVARDPEHTDARDWEYERDLAGALLEDTRLYRRAAQDRGLSDIAHVMGDLETVLLEASMSDHSDPGALERVQRLIRKRDLVVKMQVVGSTTGI
ncbi:MAG TPA: zf-HC2 domain-containing protein [Vicinamibacterales bacterium]